MQSNTGYYVSGEVAVTAVAVSAYPTPSAPPQYGAPQPQYAEVGEATAYPVTAYPASYGAPNTSVSVPQYSYGNQYSTGTAYSAVPASYSHSPYAAPSPYAQNQYSVGYAAAPVTNSNTSVGLGSASQATNEFAVRLCWFGVAFCTAMMIVGIVLLSTAPPLQCPDDCVRQKCYAFDDDQHLNDDEPEMYRCTCTEGGNGDGHCRDPIYSKGSEGYYYLLFGVLNVVIGALGFFGSLTTMGLVLYSEGLRQHREYYTSRGLPVPPYRVGTTPN